MVSLVFVAHSRALADALVDLTRQVAPAGLRVAVAAGTGAERREFGTDATEIAAAIQSVYSDEGVLVLMDLGSALLSAEMALELLPPQMRSRTLLCPGALVEGAIAAAVQAGMGSDLETVAGEARQALQAKFDHFSTSAEPPRTAGVAQGGQTITVTLHNLHGLHVRPAARFVQAASAYAAEVWVTNLSTGKGPASARSLNSLATLGAVKGDLLSITASGPEAAQALQDLGSLVSSGFGETEEALQQMAPPQTPVSRADKAAAPVAGVPVSEGVALGPLYFHHPELPPILDYQPDDPPAEWEKLQQALQQVRHDIRERRQRLTGLIGEAKAAIFDAHLLILDDPELLEAARQRITAGGLNAAAAWRLAVDDVAAQYDTLEDDYQRARRADVSDVGNQVLWALAEQLRPKVGYTPTSEETEPDRKGFPVSMPVILAAEELTPAQVAQLDSSLVLGVITASGGTTSHSAILCRSLGIPAITGIDLANLALPPGTQLALDGFKGELWIEPGRAELRRLSEQRQRWLEERQQLIQSSRQPVALRDGRRIEVTANVGSLQQARAASLNGADGIGVLRTEFLYLGRAKPPSEDEQIEALRQICQQVEGAAVIVRTLDIGGDKFLPYLPMPPDANPYLGVRGIRLTLRQPELFLTQLRAILRTGASHPVQVMFPMIATPEELLEALELLKAAHQALHEEGLPHAWPIPTGMMVEVPSTALLSPALAPHVDFFSIGTNDLTQYALAAERGNASLVEYADALHPSVLRLIQMTVNSAHQQGKWAGVCGEIAADPAAAPILVGLGVDELSMNPADIPRLKATLRAIEPDQAAALAEKALSCTSAGEVRSLTGAARPVGRFSEAA